MRAGGDAAIWSAALASTRSRSRPREAGSGGRAARQPDGGNRLGVPRRHARSCIRCAARERFIEQAAAELGVPASTCSSAELGQVLLELETLAGAARSVERGAGAVAGRGDRRPRNARQPLDLLRDARTCSIASWRTSRRCGLVGEATIGWWATSPRCRASWPRRSLCWCSRHPPRANRA